MLKNALILTLFASLILGQAYGELVTRSEYFFDTDPGFGKGIPIPVESPSELLTLQFTADTSSLSYGFHTLYVRGRDVNGNWGLTRPISFQVDEQKTGVDQANINSLSTRFFNTANASIASSTSTTELVPGTSDWATIPLDSPQLASGETYRLILQAQASDRPPGFPYVVSFALEANPFNLPPILNFTRPPQLGEIPEDSSSPFILTVADILALLGPDAVFDKEGKIPGLAFFGFDTSLGDWFYSQNGITFHAIPSLARFESLPLSPSSQLRFRPRPEASGNLRSALSFHTWDTTNGASGTKASSRNTDFLSSISTATGYASLNLTASNDAPKPFVPPELFWKSGAAPIVLPLNRLLLDPDDATSALKWSLSQNPTDSLESFRIHPANNTLTLLPNNSHAGTSVEVTLRAEDPSGASGSIILSIAVERANFPPVAKSIPNLLLNPANPSATLDLTHYFSDPDNDSSELTFALLPGYNAALFSSINLNSQTGSLTLTGKEEGQSSTSLTLIATDPDGLTGRNNLRVSLEFPSIPDFSDPALHNSLRLNLAAQSLPASRDRIRFDLTGDIGATYILERSYNLKGAWETVETITLVDPHFSFETSWLTAEEYSATFWRLKQIAGGLPIAVSNVVAVYDLNTGTASLSVQSTSRQRFQSVEFFDGNQSMGLAKEIHPGIWTFNIKMKGSDPQSSNLYAIARDGKNNATVTASSHLLIADGRRIQPLDSNGQPVPGTFVGIDSLTETLNAFRLYPAGAAKPPFWIDFAPGARLLFIDGQFQIQFTQATITFADDPGFPIPIAVLKPLLIPFDIQDADTLRILLGLPSDDPVPLLLWGILPINWINGVAPGEEGPSEWEQLQNQKIIHPINSDSGATTNTNGTDGIILDTAWHGEFVLKPTRIKIRVAKSNPLWVTYKSDGSISMRGAVEVLLPDGGTLKGSLIYENPVYEITLAASSLRIPLLASLTGLLPADAVNCIPSNASPTQAELDNARKCLDAYRQAYLHFAASAAAEDFEGVSNPDAHPFPNTIDTATSLLHAWAKSLEARSLQFVTQALPAPILNQLRELALHHGNSSQGTVTPNSALRHQLALITAKQAFENGVASNWSASDSEAFDLAITEAQAAAESRLADPSAFESLDQLEEAIATLVEIEALRQLANEPPSALSPIALQAIDGFLQNFLQQQEIVPGVYQPAPNSLPATLDRFTASKRISDTLKLVANYEILGGEQSEITAPYVEAITQWLHRKHQTALADFQSGLATRSFSVIEFALADVIQAIADATVFESYLPVDSPLLDTSLPGTLLQTFATTFDLETTEGQNEFAQANRNLLSQFRWLNQILKAVPTASGDLANHHTISLRKALDNAFLSFPKRSDNLQQSYTARETLDILEVSLTFHRLARNHSPDQIESFWLQPSSATDPSRFRKLIAYLCETANPSLPANQLPDWTTIDRAACLILEEIQELAVEAARPDVARNRRSQQKLFQQELAFLFTHYHQAIARLWQNGAARYQTLPLIADVAFPGAIKLTKASGQLSLNTETGFFASSFSGEASLPKFDARLTVPTGRIDSQGGFEFTAHGEAKFPSTGEAIRLKIPSRSPIHISHLDGIFNASGLALLQLPGGYFLEGAIDLDDPRYAFSIAGGGFRFELGEKVNLLLPHIDTNALGNASLDTLDTLARFYQGLASSSETALNGLTTFPEPDFQSIGQPPAFDVPTVTFPFDALAATANAASSDLATLTNSNYLSALRALKQPIIDQLDGAIADITRLHSEVNDTARALAIQAELRDTNLASEQFDKAIANQALIDPALDLELKNKRLVSTRGAVVLAGRLTARVPETSENLILLIGHLHLILDQIARFQEAGGNAIPGDLDYDGIPDETDLHPNYPNPGNVVLPDSDGDSIPDDFDPWNGPNANSPKDQWDLSRFTVTDIPTAIELIVLKLNRILPIVEADYGISPQGVVTNPGKLAAIERTQLAFLARQFFDLAGELFTLEEIPLAQQLESIARAVVHEEFNRLQVPAENENLFDTYKRRLDAMIVATDSVASFSEEEIDQARDGMVASFSPIYDESQNAFLNGEREKLHQYAKLAKEIPVTLTAEKEERYQAADALYEEQYDRIRRLRGFKDELKVRDLRHPLQQWLDWLTEFASPDQETLSAPINFFALDLAQKLTDAPFDATSLEPLLASSSEQLQNLVATLEWLHQRLPAETALIQALELKLDEFTLNLSQLAEARKAWWLLGEHSRILLAAANRYRDDATNAFATSCRQAAATAIEASHKLAESFALAAEAFTLEDYTFKLPGEIQLQYAKGGLAFNRLSGDWQVSLAGKIRFHNLNGTFEIERGLLSRDGFDLSLKTSGPIAFDWNGQPVDLVIASGFSLKGGWDGSIYGAQVAATLSYTENGQPVSREAVLSYAYNPETGLHSFGLYAAFSEAVSIFSKDLVVFHGGVGVDVSASETGFASALLYANAQVGILNKSATVPGDYLPKPSDFKLLFTGKVLLGQNFTGNTTTIALREGSLLLPDGFEAKTCGSALQQKPAGNQRGSVFIPELSFLWHNDLSALELDGSLALANIRFSVEDFPNAWIDTCTLNLDFEYDSATQTSSAAFTNVDGFINLPTPTGKWTRARMSNGAWTLGGFPTFTLSLVEDMPLFDDSGVSLSLLGPLPNGTPQTFVEFSNDGEPKVILSNAARLSIANLFTDENGAGITLSTSATSILSFPVGDTFPELSDFDWDLARIEVGYTGTLYLGSSEAGVRIANPNLVLTNPRGMLTGDFELEFEFGMGIQIDGTEGAGGPSGAVLQTSGNKIIFDQAQGSPWFVPGKNCYLYGDGPDVEGPPVNLLDSAPLPFEVNKFCIEYLTTPDNLGRFSLYPTSGIPLELFNPINLRYTISASLNVADIISGRVDDLQLFFVDGVPTANINGIGFGINLSDTLGIPATGEVYIGGLQHFPNYFFSGRLVFNFKGNSVEAIAAFDCNGLRGICFGLAGAEVVISLPYGFVLTGVKGGVALDPLVKDPCSFLDLLPIDRNTGKPKNGGSPIDCPIPSLSDCDLITWEELQVLRAAQVNQTQIQTEARIELKRWRLKRSLILDGGLSDTDATAIVEGLTEEEIDDFMVDLADENDPFALRADCPDPGSCPPAAIDIACQPHPEAFTEGSPYEGRIILKFSSFEEEQLAFFGLNEDLIQSWIGGSPLDGVVFEKIAASAAYQLVSHIRELTPQLPVDFGNPTLAADIEEGIEKNLRDIELGLANAFLCILDVASPPTTATEVYIRLAEAAYAGIPCTQATIKLTGSFSYTGLSAFASVTGGIVLSGNSSAGVVGSLNIFNVPVGQAKLFLSATDIYGNPQIPSLCGEVDFGLGPLDVGNATFLYDCPGCTERLFSSFPNLFTSLSSTYVYGVMTRLKPAYEDDPTFQPNSSYGPLVHLAMLNSDEKKQAFLANMMAAPPRDSLGNYSAAFATFLGTLADSLLPRIASCGVVSPKLFGFPLSGGNENMSFKFYEGPVSSDISQSVEAIELLYSYQFSPANLTATTLLSFSGVTSVIGSFFPTIDSATASSNVQLPTAGTFLRDSATKDPLALLNDSLGNIFKTSVTTFEYRLAPLGMELGRAGGRIIFPSFEHHPNGLDPKLVNGSSHDAQLINRNLPARLEVLLATLGDKDEPNSANRLADVTWKGTGSDDFESIFEGSPSASKVTGRDLSLVDDFFPHGGFLGAANLDLPALVTRPLPGNLDYLLDNSKTLQERSQVAENLINHLLASDTVGQLAFYIPAPNPPAGDFPDSFDELLRSFRDFNPLNQAMMAARYPGETSFMQGWIDTPILGIPTGRASIALDGNLGTFKIEAEIPTDSWFSSFIGSSRLSFSLAPSTQANQGDSIDFWRLVDDIRSLRLDPNLTPTQINSQIAPLVSEFSDAIIDLGFDRTLSLIQALPKLSAEFEINNALLLDPTTGIELASIQNAQFEAYSPYFKKPGATGNSPTHLARRNGGLAIQGNLSLLDGAFSIPNAQLAISTNPANPLAVPTIDGSFSLNTMGFGPLTLQSSDGKSSDLTASFHLSQNSTSFNASGYLSTLPLGFATITPATGTQFGKLPVQLSLVSNASGWNNASFLVGPAKISIPAFGSNSGMTVHGSNPNFPFSFSLQDTWNASVSMGNQSAIHLGPTGQRWVTLTPTSPWPSSFKAQVSGVGFTGQTIALNNIPTGFTVTFPEAPAEILKDLSLPIGVAGSANIEIYQDGGFLFTATVNQSHKLAPLNETQLNSGFTIEATESYFKINANVPSIPLQGFGSIVPKTGSFIPVTFNYINGSGWQLTVNPARLRLNALGIGSTFEIHGANSTQPFTLSSFASWNAGISATELIIDPDGSTSNIALLRVEATSSVNPFISATLSGLGLGQLSFSSSFSKNINTTWFGGSSMEQSSTNLAVGLMSFSIQPGPIFQAQFGSPNNLLLFPNFPTLTSNAALVVTGNGFQLNSLSAGSIQFPSAGFPLLEATASASGNELSFQDNTLRLSLGLPTVKVTGITLPASGLESIVLAADLDDGLFTATLINDENLLLFGQSLYLKSGTHSLTASLANFQPSIALAATGRLSLTYPNPANLTQTLTTNLDLPMNFSSSGDFSQIVSAGLPSFNLGWLNLRPNGPGVAGKITVSRSSGLYAMALAGWDLSVFGNNFNDLGFAVASNGSASVTNGLASSTFNFGSGTGMPRIITGGSLPFNWNFSTGNLALTIPTTASLSLPNAIALSPGSFATGIDLPSISIGQNGEFNHTISRSISIGSVNFGTTSIAFSRNSAGVTRVLIDQDSFTYAGGTNFKLDLDASSSGNFACEIAGAITIALSGAFSVWDNLDGVVDNKLTLASLDLSLQSNASTQFTGTVTLGSTTFSIGLGTGSSFITANGLTFTLPNLPAN